MQDDSRAAQAREPIFNVPAVVVGLVAVFAVVHVARELLGEDDADWLVIALAFVPGRYGELGAEVPGAPWAAATSFFTHMLVHGNVSHLVINSAWLLAVGTPIARRLGVARFVGFFTLCGVAGAGLFGVVHWAEMVPMVGASGAISGLMGAVFRLLYAAHDMSGRMLLREHPEVAPCLSLVETFTDRPALTAIAVWVIVNFVFAVGLGGLVAPGGVAWEAHLGGFFAGLLAFGVFDRGPRAAHQSA